MYSTRSISKLFTSVAVMQPRDYCPGCQSGLLLQTDQKVATRMIHRGNDATWVR